MSGVFYCVGVREQEWTPSDSGIRQLISSCDAEENRERDGVRPEVKRQTETVWARLGLPTQTSGTSGDSAVYLKTLSEPETTRLWTGILCSEIGELSFMPVRFSLTDEEP